MVLTEAAQKELPKQWSRLPFFVCLALLALIATHTVQ